MKASGLVVRECDKFFRNKLFDYPPDQKRCRAKVAHNVIKRDFIRSGSLQRALREPKLNQAIGVRKQQAEGQAQHSPQSFGFPAMRLTYHQPNALPAIYARAYQRTGNGPNANGPNEKCGNGIVNAAE